MDTLHPEKSPVPHQRHCTLFQRGVTIACAVFTFLAGVHAADLSVPLDPRLVTVSIRLGLGDKTPSVWSGAYSVSTGRIIATDGLRFMGNDFAATSRFQCEVRRFYPRFWKRRGRKETSLPIEPNGFNLTIAETTPDSVLTLDTNQGKASVSLDRLVYGRPVRALGGRIEFERIPTYRQVVRGPAEDFAPAATASPDASVVHLVWIAFTHGKNHRGFVRLTEAPSDFSIFAEPVGGDRLWYMQIRDGRCMTPEPVTADGLDLYGPATALDGRGRLWVFWSENRDGNWDVFGRSRSPSGTWSDSVRISTAPLADFNVRAAVAADGKIWLAWQSLTRNAGSDICVACQDGDRFTAPETLAGTPANEWTPAIAAAPDGRVAVAWDTYEAGNYDIKCRVREKGRWGTDVVIAGGPENQVRPSVVFDSSGRLWIAYEISPEGWGKDFGPYDQGPRRVPLYRRRRVGVRVLDGNVLRRPQADVNLALPLPSGARRWPRSPKNAVLAAGPRLAVDRTGRIWLAARIRLTRYASNVGGTWMDALTTLDGENWRPAVLCWGTDGFLSDQPVLLPAKPSGLTIIAPSDGRIRTAAWFGATWKQRRRTRKGLPPSCTRKYPQYPDRAFNKELVWVDTGPLPPAKPVALAPLPPETPGGPSSEALAEKQAIQAMHDYKVDLGGRTLRLWRGEFHRHTEISSDGSGDGSLFDMWRYAMDMAALDWIGNGDHDNGGGREYSWWFIQKTTSIFQIPGRFTPVYSYERSVNYPDGHRNAVFAQRGIRPLPRLRSGLGRAMDDLPADAPRPHSLDTQMFYRYLKQFGGICASHTSATDMGTDWRDYDPEVEPVVEIYQGDRQNYERPGAPRSNSADFSLGGWRPLGFVSLALKKGYRLGFQSSSDHISTHMSYCNVWVENPSREAVVEAMKRRHVYASTDNIIADVRCNGHFMGDAFTTAQPPEIHVRLIGTAPFAEVVIIKDDVVVYSSRPRKRVVDFTWRDANPRPGRTSYYYVRGLQKGTASTRTVRAPDGRKVRIQLNSGELVWVSPMWITYRP